MRAVPLQAGEVTTAARGAGSLFAAALVIASFTVLAREVTPMFGATSQTLVRSALAACLLAVAGARRGRRFRLSRGELVRLLPLGALTAALGYFLATAANTTKVAVALAFLYGTSIVTAVLVGRLALKEQVTWIRFTAIVVALAGLAVYAQDLTGSRAGIAAAVAGGVCDGTCNGLRKQLRTVDRQVAATYQYAVAAILVIPVLAVSGEPMIKSAGTGPAAAMVVYGVASAALGTLLLTGFRTVDVSVGTVILATQIAFAVLLGLLLLGESPDGPQLAGAGLITAAAILIGAGERWQPPPHSTLRFAAER